MVVSTAVSREPRPLIEMFDQAVRRHADAVALRMEGEQWTYRQLGALVDRWTVALVTRGVVPGSRIALSAGNSPDLVAAVFASARLGAAIVMVSTAWREVEVRHAIALAEPTHVIHDGSGATSLDVLAPDLPILRIGEIEDPSGAPRLPSADVDIDDIAVLVFSSGTTGLPKAVRHSHRTLHTATLHWMTALGLGPDDRLQITTPPFHILGLLNLLVVVAAGASVRLHRRFELDTVLRAIEEDRITVEMVVAPMALAMAAHPELERFDLSSLRYIMWGATPVTPTVAATITSRTGVRFLPAYGASELPVIAVNPVHRPDEWRLDSVGLAPSDVQLRVVDLCSGDVLEPDCIGELQARSPSRMVGYLPASANVDSIVDGWYRTGDVGSIDAEGWVSITDRVKEMIKVNGFQVAPAEIEGVLLGHPGIVDCAVFGVPHPRTGEAVVAAVVRSQGADVSADDLRELVADRLASYKRMEDVVFLDQIPRLPSGKVLRRELKSAYGS